METDKKKTSDSPQNALRRLVVVLGIAIGFIIYSYGWTVTEIDLERPQEEQRQQNVSSALRDLLSPNLFEQDRDVQTLTANYLVDCEDDGESVTQPENEQGVITLTPECGQPGSEVRIEVTGLVPLAPGRIRWVPPGEDNQIRPRDVLETGRDSFVFDNRGNFVGTIEVPRIRGTDGQIAQIEVQAAVPIGTVRFSETAVLVFERMVETIFMALVATTVAVPIAALISFFAARNLMAPIRLSVGSILVAFISFVVGLWLGGLVLAPLADLGVGIGSATDVSPPLAFIIPIAVVAALIFVSRLLVGTAPQRNPTITDRIRGIASRVLFAVAAVFLVGALGGLGLLGSEQMLILADNIGDANVIASVTSWAIAAVANMLAVLSEIVTLFTGVIGAFFGGFVLSGIASELVSPYLRTLPPVINRIAGAILGGLSGAFLLAFTGSLGAAAALLGLLSPIVAAIIGGQILVQIYSLVTNTVVAPVGGRSFSQSSVRNILFMIGALITFFIVFTYLSVDRAVIDGTLPPVRTQEVLGFTVTTYILENALVGLILGAISGALAGVRAAFPAGSILYNVSRTILNTVRSIEPLIMGLVFVIWVGIGPFAGVLALTLHSIAALGKLYSEQVENIDDGPVEALESTGANRLQTIIYAVVPQIVPPYIAFTMYRWDINVRMSTIIGFVGGGGIGLLLQQQINLLRYRDAGVAVLAIAVVVSILDYASASIRSRIV